MEARCVDNWRVKQWRVEGWIVEARWVVGGGLEVGGEEG